LSYLVFARKWRPQSFDEVLAQGHVTVTLKNAIKSGRIGHSYLFAGPRGVGKTTTARILAKALNCEEGPTPEPCQKCAACVGITRGSYLDVLEIDGASNRGIDEIRDLREKARYATSAGRYKIYIIDEVHMLTTEAFNALLKILEEPPSGVIFIFATTQPRKVPATILSRCQRFDFRRIPASVMTDYIRSEAEKEDISIDSNSLALISRASGGSLRDALSIMDQLVSFAGKEINSDQVADFLGVVESDLLASLSEAVLSGKQARALEIVAGAMDEGYGVRELVESMLHFLRQLLMVAAGAEKALEAVSESEMELIRRTAGAASDVSVLNVLRIFSGGLAEIRQGGLPRVALESAVMSAAKLSQALELDELPEVSKRSGPRPPDGPADVPVPEDREAREAQQEESAEKGNEQRDEPGPTRKEEEEVSRKVFDLFDAIPRDRS
jgi:DNA polymerase-3 subunit gamma/tau